MFKMDGFCFISIMFFPPSRCTFTKEHVTSLFITNLHSVHNQGCHKVIYHSFYQANILIALGRALYHSFLYAYTMLVTIVLGVHYVPLSHKSAVCLCFGSDLNSLTICSHGISYH